MTSLKRELDHLHLSGDNGNGETCDQSMTTYEAYNLSWGISTVQKNQILIDSEFAFLDDILSLWLVSLLDIRGDFEKYTHKLKKKVGPFRNTYEYGRIKSHEGFFFRIISNEIASCSDWIGLWIGRQVPFFSVCMPDGAHSDGHNALRAYSGIGNLNHSFPVFGIELSSIR